MQWARRNRRGSSWIAIASILIASLVPTMSHALRGTDSSELIEVCSAMGPRWISAAQTAPDLSSPSPTQAHDDCPCCVLHALAVALPPTLPTCTLLALDFVPPWHPAVASASPAVLYAALARGPPLSI
jgi:hypothetical protein